VTGLLSSGPHFFTVIIFIHMKYTKNKDSSHILSCIKSLTPVAKLNNFQEEKTERGVHRKSRKRARIEMSIPRSGHVVQRNVLAKNDSDTNSGLTYQPLVL